LQVSIRKARTWSSMVTAEPATGLHPDWLLISA